MILSIFNFVNQNFCQYYLFSIFFSIDLKVWGYLTLLISWFINLKTKFPIFNRSQIKLFLTKTTPYSILDFRPCSEYSSIFRNCRPEVFCKKGVLSNFAKFTGKHLCYSLFFHKVAGLRPATLLKKRLRHRCFPLNFAKLLRTPFLTEYLCWLLLYFFTLLNTRVHFM